jgi:hypothetical protein
VREQLARMDRRLARLSKELADRDVEDRAREAADG